MIGSHLDDDRGWNSGSVHVFPRDGTQWPAAKIVPSLGNERGYFGFSVAIDEWIAVGSPVSNGSAVPRAYE